MRIVIDWCTFTFAFQQGKTTLGELLEDLSTVTGLQLTAEERRAQPGYSDGVQIYAHIVGDHGDIDKVRFAVFAWGGDSQRGRAMLALSGECCGCIDDWALFAGYIERLPEYRLTRVDVACDFMDGEYTVDDVVEWQRQGLFNVGGRNPATRTDGDWLERIEGRTLYVGKAKNGKGLRCYEKGKQLKQMDSKWVRMEVQFGNRDRIIPIDILTEPMKYFAGAYPALARIVAQPGDPIDTMQTQAAVTFATICSAIKRTYGKYFHVAALGGITAQELFDELRIHVIPGRFQSSAVVAGVLRPAVHESFQKWRAPGG